MLFSPLCIWHLPAAAWRGEGRYCLDATFTLGAPTVYVTPAVRPVSPAEIYPARGIDRHCRTSRDDKHEITDRREKDIGRIFDIEIGNNLMLCETVIFLLSLRRRLKKVYLMHKIFDFFVII